MTVKRRQRGAVGAEEVVACAVDVDLMKHGSKSHGSEGGEHPRSSKQSPIGPWC